MNDDLTTPDQVVRYDVLLKELQRERAAHAAARQQHQAEIEALRVALGLNPSPGTAVAQPRSMVDGR